MKTETPERSPNETLADALIEAAAIVRRLPHCSTSHTTNMIWLFSDDTLNRTTLPALVKALGGSVKRQDATSYITLTRELSPYLKLCVGVERKIGGSEIILDAEVEAIASQCSIERCLAAVTEETEK